LTWCAVCARLLLLMASTTSSLVALCATSRALRKSSCSLSSWPLLTFGLSRLVTAVVHCCRSLLSCTAVVHCCRALDPTPYIRLRLCPCVYILLCECYTGSCACLCDQTSRVGCFLEAAFYAYDRQHADQYFPIVSSFCIVSTPYELRVLFPKDFFLQLHL